MPVEAQSQAQPAAAAPSAQQADTANASGVDAVVQKAFRGHDPLKALGEAYAKATPQQQQQMRDNENFQAVISDAVMTATAVLTNDKAALADQDKDLSQDPLNPQKRADRAIKSVNEMVQRLDPAFAGVVAQRAAKVFMDHYSSHLNQMPNGAGFSSVGVAVLVSLSSRIAGSPQGDGAIAGFVTLNAWDGPTVSRAMANGAGNAYAIAYARYTEATTHDSSFALRSLEETSLHETRVALQTAAASDLRELAKFDAEMGWVASNVCGPLGPGLAQKGMNGYLESKSWEDKLEDEKLHTRVADNGAKLLRHMIALNKVAREAGLAPAMQEQLVALANDEASGLAIQMAFEKYPELIQGEGLKDIVELVEALRNTQHLAWGDKSASRLELTESAIAKLGVLTTRVVDAAARDFVYFSTDKSDPIFGQRVRPGTLESLQGLRKGYLGRLLGVPKEEMDQAITSTQRFAEIRSRAEVVMEVMHDWSGGETPVARWGIR